MQVRNKERNRLAVQLTTCDLPVSYSGTEEDLLYILDQVSSSVKVKTITLLSDTIEMNELLIVKYSYPV